ncbi:GNAT family N-acetyltransferase [Ilumatobacter sp.]|uniref:GNAT family N-acetyltransferase n=1 Tax=Ilumatobacter sp. TaxID=1967498 RepID=UPI003B5287BF
MRADELQATTASTASRVGFEHSLADLQRLTSRRLVAASRIHSRDFGMSRFRSVLHLASGERTLLRDSAVCSLSRVPTGRFVAAIAAALAGLICLPGLALALIVGDEGNRTARLLLLATVCVFAAVGIFSCVRQLVDARKWWGLNGRIVVLSNVAVARRGEGLGRALLDDVVRLADRNGWRLALAVDDDALAARHLYGSVGFVEVQRHGQPSSRTAMSRPSAQVDDRSSGTTFIDGALLLLLVSTTAFVISSSSLSWSSRIAVGCALWLLCSASRVDLRSHRLPNRLLATAALLAGLAVALTDTFDVVLIAAGMGAAPFLLVHLVDPAALGFGDVKYATVAGALMAVWWWPGAVAMSVATLATTCLVRVLRPTGPLPMGPTLFVGTTTAVVASILLAQKGLLP